MTTTEQPPFTQLMMSIAELYGKPLSKPLLDIYWRCLEPYALVQVSAALRAHILHPDHGQFMPKPADILRHITGNCEVQALQAWSKVLQAIRAVGSYQSIAFDDPLIHAVITDLGGWIALCRHDAQALTWVGKQFEKLYSSYLTRPPQRYPRQLMGLFEQHNNLTGYLGAEAVCFFGEQSKAKTVWHQGCHPAAYIPQRAVPVTKLLDPALNDHASDLTPVNPSLPLPSGEYDGKN